jgi:hypothetical protein
MTDPVDRGRNRSETFAEFALRPLPATSRRGFVAVPTEQVIRPKPQSRAKSPFPINEIRFA